MAEEEEEKALYVSMLAYSLNICSRIMRKLQFSQEIKYGLLYVTLFELLLQENWQRFCTHFEEGTYLRDDGCICPIKKEEEVVKEERKKGKTSGCPYDPRFPNQNQTKHCYTSFIDFQRCARLLGNYPGCLLFYRCYRTLCPGAWVERWFEQMEKGTFPRKIFPSKPIVRLDPNDVTECEEEEEEEEEEVPC